MTSPLKMLLKSQKIFRKVKPVKIKNNIHACLETRSEITLREKPTQNVRLRIDRFSSSVVSVAFLLFCINFLSCVHNYYSRFFTGTRWCNRLGRRVLKPGVHEHKSEIMKENIQQTKGIYKLFYKKL